MLETSVLTNISHVYSFRTLENLMLNYIPEMSEITNDNETLKLNSINIKKKKKLAKM